MKTIFVKTAIGLTVATCVGVSACFAANSDRQFETVKTILKSAPRAEMPAKAANLVVNAKAAEKQNTAVTAVRAAISISPPSTLAVVGAICRVAPETAPAVAEAAVGAQPQLENQIVKTASTVAPGYASAIASAPSAVKRGTKTVTATGGQTKGPRVGPPLTSGGGTGGETTPNSSGTIPPGGVRYSSP